MVQRHSRTFAAVIVLILAMLACSKAADITPVPDNTQEVYTIPNTPTSAPTHAPTVVPTATPRPIIVVVAQTLNCRETPSTSARVIAVVPYNATFVALQMDGDWVRVIPARGADPCWLYQGWVVLND